MVHNLLFYSQLRNLWKDRSRLPTFQQTVLVGRYHLDKHDKLTFAVSKTSSEPGTRERKKPLSNSTATLVQRLNAIPSFIFLQHRGNR